MGIDREWRLLNLILTGGNITGDEAVALLRCKRGWIGELLDLALAGKVYRDCDFSPFKENADGFAALAVTARAQPKRVPVFAADGERRPPKRIVGLPGCA